MRKILSLILGLLWTLPVWGANCNLFDGTITHWAYTINPNRVNVSPSYMGITLPVTENKTYTFSRATAVGNRFVRYFTTDVPVEGMAVYDVNPNISIDTLTHTFTVPAGMKYVVFYFDVSGADISNSKMQLEEGSTATAYTPYNPLCATCDGTVVNYTSATGTGVQNGTPTPTNPIEPTFYKQGNMILRKVGDYADSYDATTGKITRRVGKYAITGNEDWVYLSSSKKVFTVMVSDALLWKSQSGCLSNAFACTNGIPSNFNLTALYLHDSVSRLYMGFPEYDNNVNGFKQWLRDQYAAGTPVTVYYPLTTEVVEDWTETSYCETPIKIATTKYNESAFSPLNTALANAISVVDSVVSNTITQAGRIATLQSQKQTRPNDIADDNEKCPAGKKCLLVEDASGIPHWYEIVERYSILPDGYTELEYIESTGTQWIDTGVSEQNVTNLEIDFETSNSTSTNGFIFVNGTSQVGVRDARYGLSSPGRYTITESKNNVSAWVVKNETNGTTFTNMQSASPSTLALFNLMNTTGTIGSYYCKDLKIYYFKAYNGNTLVQHLVPAKNPDGVIGMYDTVNGVFYENKGTGEFIGGQPVFN